MVESAGLYEMLQLGAAVFMVFGILLMTCSFLMWNKKEKLSKAAYIISIFLTVILYLMNIFNIHDRYLERGIFEMILLTAGGMLIIFSMLLNRKRYITQTRITMNIATIIGVIIFSRIIFILN